MTDRVATIPNAISFVRLLTVPVFWWAILTDRFLLATVIVASVGSTDWLDGYLARRLNQVSKLGAFLDPLADRLMIASAVVGGLIVGVLPALIGYPLLVREVAVGLGAALLARRGVGTLAVRYRGKVATLLVYWSIPAFFLAEATSWTGFFTWFGWIAGTVGLILYWWVAIEYWGDARQRLSATPEETRDGPVSE